MWPEVSIKLEMLFTLCTPACKGEVVVVVVSSLVFETIHHKFRLVLLSSQLGIDRDSS